MCINIYFNKNVCIGRIYFIKPEITLCPCCLKAKNLLVFRVKKRKKEQKKLKTSSLQK